MSKGVYHERKLCIDNESLKVDSSIDEGAVNNSEVENRAVGQHRLKEWPKTEFLPVLLLRNLLFRICRHEERNIGFKSNDLFHIKLNF